MAIPDDIPFHNNDGIGGQTTLMGFWQIAANEATGTIEIIPARGASWSMNVLGMLEDATPLGLEIDTNYVDVDPVEHRVSVEVRVLHPVQASAGLFTVFDIRGIVFGPKVMNADGWTTHLNPKDFSGVQYGYMDGSLGTPHSYANYTGRRFGYKYFCDGLASDDDLVTFFKSPAGLANRGRLSEGNGVKRRYILDWDDSKQGFLVFNYAVLASYAWPKPGSTAPYGLDDFTTASANCAEAFCMSAAISNNSAYYDGVAGGGEFDIEVEVWDWQGLESTEVSVKSAGGDSPGNINGICPRLNHLKRYFLSRGCPHRTGRA